MIGVEIDMIVANSLQALAMYARIFDIEHIEATAYPQGLNEAIFTMYNTRFHLLDENREYQMFAPRPGDPKPMWINVVVPDICKTFEQALENGCILLKHVRSGQLETI